MSCVCFPPVSAAVSLHVLNGGRQCICYITDTLLNGVRGCGNFMAAPVLLDERIIVDMTRADDGTMCTHRV